MCGIVGYIGDKKATPILINGLKKLEYRGYDSAGIAIVENNALSVFKEKGRVKNLENADGINNCIGNIGIAHTRWATHGKPSNVNAHPQTDNSNSFAVVHNGIIENYNELKDFLISNGYKFYSQTDTETIPNLIHYYYSKDTLNDNDKFLRALNSACKDLKGSYAIEAISKENPNCILVVRKDSPLVLGTSRNENYIASDIPAILSYTKDFYLLNDNEFAIIKNNSIKFYDKDLVEHKKEITKIDMDISAAEKNGYDDYMSKEIFEQPTAIKETISPRIRLNEKCSFTDLDFTKEYLSNLSKIYIIACGTAMHAGLTGKTLIEKLCKIPTIVDVASEFRYRDPLIDNKTLCIFISQSGETADTLAALKLAKKQGSKTLAISNVIGSSITREADYTLYTHAGPEIAVASTKAYTSQIALISTLAIYFAETLESKNTKILEEIKESLLSVPDKINNILNNTEPLKNYAYKIYKNKDVFYLGRGNDYNVASEGALKLKEISYTHADAYSAGELKHGPIALIENNVPVIGIITDEELAEKTISNIQEVITRGASTLIVSSLDLQKSNYDEFIKIPEIHPLISPILSVIPLQLLAYYITKNKNLDVDKPRNLAKSVTVE